MDEYLWNHEADTGENDMSFYHNQIAGNQYGRTWNELIYNIYEEILCTVFYFVENCACKGKSFSARTA